MEFPGIEFLETATKSRNRKKNSSSCVYIKAGFHMIADRRSQIAIRSAIVCDHMETTSAIVCDPAIMIADDRRR